MVQVLTLLFIGMVYLVAVWRPAWATAVVLTMFPIEQALQASSSLFRDRGSLANMAIGVLVLVSLTFSFIRGRLVMRSWVTAPMVLTTALYCWAATSYFWTFSPEWLAEYIRWTTPYILVTIGLAPLLIAGLDDLRELRIALLVIGTAVALLIIANPNFQFVGGRLVVNVDNDSRTNPLAIGALGGLLVLLLILGPSKETHPGILALRLAAFVIGLGLGFLSGSRGEVLAAVGAGAIFLPMARRISNPAQYFATIAVAVTFGIGIMVVRGFFVGSDNADRWSFESISSGSSGRFENAADLFALYLARPTHWLQGLGSVAFHNLPTRSGDPYSHVIVADLICELGLPGVVLASCLGVLAVRNSRRLFRSVKWHNEARALVTLLSAFSVYQFILANKAGIIWAQYDLFFGICLLARLTLLEAGDTANDEEPVDASEEAEPEFDEGVRTARIH